MVRAIRQDEFYIELINIVLLPNKLRPDGTSISSYSDFEILKNNEYYRKMMFATKFIPRGGGNTGYYIGTDAPEPYETTIDSIFGTTEEAIIQNWIRRLEEWDDGGAAAMPGELSLDTWITKWSSNPEIHAMWEHFGWPDATALPEEWHVATVSYIRSEFDLDIAIELTDEQIKEWVSQLRIRDLNGNLPEEWITEVTSGRPRIFSKFSDIIEVNLLDTVSDLAAKAVYNFYTANEGDVRIENIGIRPADNPHPRWINLSWTPMLDPIAAPREGYLPGETTSIPRGYMNNFSGGTIEIEIEGELTFDEERLIR